MIAVNEAHQLRPNAIGSQPSTIAEYPIALPVIIFEMFNGLE